MTQTQRVLTLLERRPVRGLTAFDAFRYGAGMRLAARISELKADGHDITATMVKRGDSRVALYRLTT